MRVGRPTDKCAAVLPGSLVDVDGPAGGVDLGAWADVDLPDGVAADLPCSSAPVDGSEGDAAFGVPVDSLRLCAGYRSAFFWPPYVVARVGDTYGRVDELGGCACARRVDAVGDRLSADVTAVDRSGSFADVGGSAGDAVFGALVDSLCLRAGFPAVRSSTSLCWLASAGCSRVMVEALGGCVGTRRAGAAEVELRCHTIKKGHGLLRTLLAAQIAVAHAPRFAVWCVVAGLRGVVAGALLTTCCSSLSCSQYVEPLP